MSIFMKTLKVQKFRLGLMTPREMASELYNPLLSYLDTQYNLVSHGESPRNMDIRVENDSSNLEWRFYWNEFLRYFTTFKGIIDGIKNSQYSVSDQSVIQQLYQAGNSCAEALLNDYMRMVALYFQIKDLPSNRGGVLDDPTSAYFHWTDYLNPFNWGKSKWEIEQEKEEERQSAIYRLKQQNDLRKALYQDDLNSKIKEVRPFYQ